MRTHERITLDHHLGTANERQLVLAIFYILAIDGSVLLGLLPRGLAPASSVVGQFINRQLSLGGGPICIPPAFLGGFGSCVCFLRKALFQDRLSGQSRRG